MSVKESMDEQSYCSVDPDVALLTPDSPLDPFAPLVPFGTVLFISSIMSAPLEISCGCVRPGTPSVREAVFSPVPFSPCPNPADTSVWMLPSMVKVLPMTPGARGNVRATLLLFLFLSRNLQRTQSRIMSKFDSTRRD